MPAPRINQKNFAINSRIYDTKATKTMYDAAIIKTGSTTNALTAMTNINFDNVNPDTAMGQSWFHENRCRGTAAFTYSF